MATWYLVFVFSDEFLAPRPGIIRYWPADTTDPAAETWSITVPLATFSASDRYDPSTFCIGASGPEIIETSLQLDFIQIPAQNLSELSRRTFTFPVNPEDGFIDASVYLGGGHCPVDVTQIEFGPERDGQIQAVLHTAFDFAAEAVEIENRAAVMTVDLHIPI
ncbi:hypothetical protein [Nocardia concava]|uniref:hypothetical protein n=1 Tax=Nocardia concava TaxID=257281 RepID=UPI000684A956|nr:hypothetical protein [Nocardia concava]